MRHKRVFKDIFKPENGYIGGSGNAKVDGEQTGHDDNSGNKITDLELDMNDSGRDSRRHADQKSDRQRQNIHRNKQLNILIPLTPQVIKPQ